MKQYNQIGKKTNKDDVLDAKKGRTFVCPKGREYGFDYEKPTPRKYIFVVLYKGKRYKMNESDFNRIPMSDILDSLDKHIQEIESGKFD
jgi:hypothetical protein